LRFEAEVCGDGEVDGSRRRGLIYYGRSDAKNKFALY
jgi:hypothetical protein